MSLGTIARIGAKLVAVGSGVQNFIAIGSGIQLGYNVFKAIASTQGGDEQAIVYSRTEHRSQKDPTIYHDWIKTGIKRIILIEKDSDYTLHRHQLAEFEKEAEDRGIVGLGVKYTNVPGVTSSPPCLLQLATCSGTCLLIRLHDQISLNSGIKSLLSNPNILKAGVKGPRTYKKLDEFLGFKTRSWLDVRRPLHRQLSSLNEMAADMLGVQIPENLAHDWSAPEYSQSQICYAALDANVTLRLFIHYLSDCEILNPDDFKKASGNVCVLFKGSLVACFIELDTAKELKKILYKLKNEHT